jgi:hypothetical protein
MKPLTFICGALLFAAGALMAPAQEGKNLEVQIRYTGSGTVDDNHKIFVALWDSPGFVDGSSGPPVAVQSTNSKNGSVTFTDVQKVPAYVSVAFDPTGKWDAQSGPPPTGSSLGMYSKAPPKPEPINITPGKTAKAAITFDDTQKVQ